MLHDLFLRKRITADFGLNRNLEDDIHILHPFLAENERDRIVTFFQSRLGFSRRFHAERNWPVPALVLDFRDFGDIVAPTLNQLCSIILHMSYFC